MTSVFGTVLNTWHDVFQGMRRMPVLLASALVPVTAADLVATWLVPYGSRTLPLPLFGAYAAVASVHALVLVPVAIAIHRLVILNEATSRYAVDLTSKRVLRYFGLTVLFIFVPWINPFLTALLAGGEIKTGFEYSAFISLIISLACVLAFPAIAVDSPRATGRKITRAIKGHFWRIAIVFVAASMPVGVLRVVLHLLLDDQSGSRFLAAPLVAGLDIVQMVIFASVGARHYRLLTHRIPSDVRGNGDCRASACIDGTAPK